MITQNEPEDIPELMELSQRVQVALRSNKLSLEDKQSLSYLYGSGLMFLAAAKLLLEDEKM